MTEYRNPILGADWSDPDAIRVGSDYYLTASTFNRVPGLPILHSKDLVHWGLIGHALPRLVPEAHYDLPRHGSGVWAPALRHHDDRFFIFYPDPDHGIYVVTATEPSGPWSEPHLLYPGRGLIDPCPFWDEDGRAYLVHAWAKTRAGSSNVITMHEMAPDGSRLLGPGTVVVDGESLPGFTLLEGPKMHRRDGWYWIFAPAGSVPTGWQSVFRSRSVWGPYEERTVLAQGSTTTNGPHQGTWVEAVDGTDWFIHFQELPPHGRVVHLQPMGWSADGWPQMGTNADGRLGRSPGEPVARHRAPAGDPEGSKGTPVSGGDDWTEGIGRQWYWQANPRDEWWTAEGDGSLRLRAMPGDPVNLRELPNVLAQRLPAEPCEVTVSVELEDPVTQARAGLVVLGLRYCWLGLVSTDDGVVVTAGSGGETRKETRLLAPVEVSGRQVELRARFEADGAARLSWRAPGGGWADVPASFRASPGFWVGADVGVFATSPVGSSGCTAVFGGFEMRLTDAED